MFLGSTFQSAIPHHLVHGRMRNVTVGTSVTVLPAVVDPVPDVLDFRVHYQTVTESGVRSGRNAWNWRRRGRRGQETILVNISWEEVGQFHGPVVDVPVIQVLSITHGHRF